MHVEPVPYGLCTHTLTQLIVTHMLWHIHPPPASYPELSSKALGPM